MAMVTCRKCNEAVSDAAWTCPNCGVHAPSINAGALAAIFGVIAVMLFLFFRANDIGTSSSPEPVEAHPMTTTQPAPTPARTNLALSVDANGCSVPTHESSEQFGLILNLNHLLCAKVVRVCPLKVKDALEVTCIEYRGGHATKTYIVDINTASAFEQ